MGNSGPSQENTRGLNSLLRLANQMEMTLEQAVFFGRVRATVEVGISTGTPSPTRDVTVSFGNQTEVPAMFDARLLKSLFHGHRYFLNQGIQTLIRIPEFCHHLSRLRC